MLLKKESSFRNIPIGIDIQQARILEAIRYSIDISDASYNRLLDNLYKFSFLNEDKNITFPVIFSDVWSVITNLTIFLNIVSKRFKIDEKNEIFDKIRILKLLRHSVQHIEDRLTLNENPEQYPVFGSLSWYAKTEANSKEGFIFTLISSGVIVKDFKGNIYNPASKHNDDLINGIEFTAIVRVNKELIEKTINLKEIIENVSSILNHFDEQLNSQISFLDKGHHGSDISIVMKVSEQEKQ